MYMAFGVTMWGGFTFGKCISNKLVGFCKHYPKGRCWPHLKRINIFLSKDVLMKSKIKSGKNLSKSGKNQGISWDKKSGNPGK